MGASCIISEDCEYTGYSEHFLERYYGSGYVTYWEEFKSEVTRSTNTPHAGSACMTYNPFGSGDSHATVGVGVTDHGSNTSEWDPSLVHNRIWYFRWYHRWETGIQWNGTLNKTIHVNQNSTDQGTSLTVIREGSTVFHITLRNNGNIIVNTWANVAQTLDDMQWHKMELYIDYGTNNSDAELFFKCDDSTVYSGSNISMLGIESNPVKFLNAWPGNISGVAPTGTAWQWLDDLEIWDGLPDAEEPALKELSIGGTKELITGGTKRIFFTEQVEGEAVTGFNAENITGFSAENITGFP